MKKVVLIAIMAMAFIGCSTGELTIAKCDKYENDVCVNAHMENLKECKEPFSNDGKVYCK